MNDLTKEQVKRTLEQTFGGDKDRPLEYFNVSPLYGLSRRLNLRRQNPRWDALYAAHTVRFGDMSDQEKTFLALNLVNYFGVSEDPEDYNEGTRLRKVLDLAKEQGVEDPFEDELIEIEKKETKIGFDIDD